MTSSEKTETFLKELLTEKGYLSLFSAKTSGEAKQLLRRDEFDLVIISAPLAGESGYSLATEIKAATIAEVLFVVNQEAFEEVSVYMETFGIYTLSKPVGKSMFFTCLKLIETAHSNALKLVNEKKILENSLEEQKLLARAKFVLIQYLAMSEDMAHKYIERQAMDMRCTKLEIAKNILKTYED